MPSSPSEPDRGSRLERLIVRPFAHRGLHGGSRIENSRAAFQAAIDGDYGIELDVQPSRSGTPFVFHDETLDRLGGQSGLVAELADPDLAKIRLADTEEFIPSLDEILKLISGRSPLLIEIKPGGRAYRRLCHGVRSALRGYTGPFAIMSFDPRVSRWFARHSTETLRGLVVTEAGEPERGRLRRRLAAYWSRADFLAYDIRDLPSPFAERQRRRGRPVLTWTCRSEDQRRAAAVHADQIIFEQES